MKARRKYLAQYAEPEAALTASITGSYQHVLVLPCYRESPSALRRFIDFAQQQPYTLMIVVVNRPEDDNDTAWAQSFIARAMAASQAILWQQQHCSHLALAAQSGLLLVDRCLQGEPIQRRFGVGLARKVGADIALALIEKGIINSPWIHNTDADACLPSNYFNATKKLDHQRYAAACYPFTHTAHSDPVITQATALYELSLHYYVAACRWAGSAYAYHTIGSCIAFTADAYAAVRGFPKRAGGEDFYLLGKLAKVAEIHSLDTPRIELKARLSDRVPFGTGPAVSRIAQLENQDNKLFYHPNCFRYLKHLLDCGEQLVSRDQPSCQGAMIEALQQTTSALTAQALLDYAQQSKFLLRINQSQQQGRDRQSRLRHWRTSMDAFQILKAVHFFRDHSCGSLNAEQLVQTLHDSVDMPTLHTLAVCASTLANDR
jgi:hypothetical protein